MDITIKEFLRILQTGGVNAWNNWFINHRGAWIENRVWENDKRPPYPLVTINLAHGDFSRMNLNGIVLDGADLRGSKFEKTKLRRARIRCAEASSAAFIKSDLTGADLRFSIIHNADFRGARLEGSSIYLAIENRNTRFGNAETTRKTQ